MQDFIVSIHLSMHASWNFMSQQLVFLFLRKVTRVIKHPYQIGESTFGINRGSFGLVYEIEYWIMRYSILVSKRCTDKQIAWKKFDIGVFSNKHSLTFLLNREIYIVCFCIQLKFRNVGTKKIPNWDNFHAMIDFRGWLETVFPSKRKSYIEILYRLASLWWEYWSQ